MDTALLVVSACFLGLWWIFAFVALRSEWRVWRDDGTGMKEERAEAWVAARYGVLPVLTPALTLAGALVVRDHRPAGWAGATWEEYALALCLLPLPLYLSHLALVAATRFRTKRRGLLPIPMSAAKGGLEACVASIGLGIAAMLLLVAYPTPRNWVPLLGGACLVFVSWERSRRHAASTGMRAEKTTSFAVDDTPLAAEVEALARAAGVEAKPLQAIQFRLSDESRGRLTEEALSTRSAVWITRFQAGSPTIPVEVARALPVEAISAAFAGIYAAAAIMGPSRGGRLQLTTSALCLASAATLLYGHAFGPGAGLGPLEAFGLLALVAAGGCALALGRRKRRVRGPEGAELALRLWLEAAADGGRQPLDFLRATAWFCRFIQPKRERDSYAAQIATDGKGMKSLTARLGAADSIAAILSGIDAFDASERASTEAASAEPPPAEREIAAEEPWTDGATPPRNT